MSRRSCVRPVASGGGKTDLSKVGLNSIENDTVKANLMGKSRYMDKKGWVDSQGRKGKVRNASLCVAQGFELPALHPALCCQSNNAASTCILLHMEDFGSLSQEFHAGHQHAAR